MCDATHSKKKLTNSNTNWIRILLAVVLLYVACHTMVLMSHNFTTQDITPRDITPRDIARHDIPITEPLQIFYAEQTVNLKQFTDSTTEAIQETQNGTLSEIHSLCSGTGIKRHLRLPKPKRVGFNVFRLVGIFFNVFRLVRYSCVVFR